MTILLIDEMDYLKTTPTVMYDFCNWPMKTNSKLFVIGISNTIDLLEQQQGRNVSRTPIGKQNRIVFSAYVYDQMKIILESRLLEYTSTILDSKSIELIARKAAQAGGDIRRALKICQRVIEMIRDKIFINDKITSNIKYLKEINTACAEYSESPIVVSIQCASELDKAIFVCLFRYVSVASDDLSKAINGYELYIRLGQLLSEIDIRQKNPTINATFHNNDDIISLIFPPWNIFKLAIDRLITHGFCKKIGNVAHRNIATEENNNGNMLLQATLIQLSVDISDIKTALRKSPFIYYIDPSLNFK